jgi:hypothetical protein
MSMTLIAHTELGSAASSITFSSIPATFTDLLIVSSLRSSASGQEQDGQITFNGSTSGYSERMLVGYGNVAASAAASGSRINWAMIATGASQTSNTFSNSAVYIPNYRTSAAKSVSGDAVAENNATGAQMRIDAALWNNTDAINSITITVGSGNFVQYSSATLYGITAGSSGGVVVS